MTDIDKLQKRPIIFVHGAWHGAWCWDQWIDFFKKEKFNDVIAIELRGHGYKTGSFKRARLEDYVNDVKTMINVYDEEPILIGHSLGCSIIQELLAERSFPAAILLAPVPESRLFREVFVKQLVRHPVISLRSVASSSMSPWVTSRKSARLFFSDYMPASEAKHYTERMQDESFRLFMLDLLRTAPKVKLVTPTLVVAAQNDKFFSVKVQRTTATDIGADFFVSQNSGHDIMLDTSSEQSAKEVITWLENNATN